MCKDTSITDNYNKTKEKFKIATYPQNRKVPMKFTHAIVKTNNNKEYKALILSENSISIKIQWINKDLIIPYSTMKYDLDLLSGTSLNVIGFVNA